MQSFVQWPGGCSRRGWPRPLPRNWQPGGVTATQYVERYGGYGRCRGIRDIMWQVALVLDRLQNENIAGAKGAIALLAVCPEQTALDNGRMDVALLLSLAEASQWLVHQQDFGHPLQGSRFCATSGSEMDHQCLVLHQGARHHHKPAHRHSRKTEGGQARRPSKSSVQESCKEDSPPLEEEEPGRGGGGPIAEDFHAAFTSFHKVLAALPRWVLASRTHLLRSSHNLLICNALATPQLPWCIHCLFFLHFSAGASPSYPGGDGHPFEGETEAYHHCCAQLSPWWHLPEGSPLAWEAP